MNRKQVGAALLVACLALIMANSPAAAGCCFVLSLDELPTELYVDQARGLSFRASLNGEIPLPGLEPVLRFEHQRTGRTLTLEAAAAEQPGRYLAEFTPPVAGEWNWSIEVVGGSYAMPALTAVAAGAAGSTSARGEPDMRTSLRWTGAALLLAAAGLTVMRRREPEVAHQAAGG